MIVSFRDKKTEEIFNRKPTKRVPSAILRRIRKTLNTLHAATSLSELRAIPGNRLEKLKGNREGQHSMRVNEQYRICFEWKDGNALNAELVDYHS